VKPPPSPLSGLPSRLLTGLALPFALMLLAWAPSSALAHAKGHRSSCSSSAARSAAHASAHASAHAKPATRTCPHTTHKSKSKGKGHRPTKPGTTQKVGKGTRPAASGSAHATPASCEDGGAPTRSGNGSQLLCPAPQGDEAFCSDGSAGECTVSWANTGAPACEDGTAPLLMSDGSFACDDESEPACEDGSLPTPSPDGSELLCADAAEES